MSGKGNKRKRRAERRKSSETSGDVSKKKRQKSAEKPPADCGTSDMGSSSCLIFQDVMEQFLDENTKEELKDEEVSLSFFELANSPSVGYRVNDNPSSEKSGDTTNCIVIKQDTDACGRHTGGIVWETSYLLLQYILSKNRKLGKTLEVGAGCGLLGQVLAAKKAADAVVMTEHTDVMPNLSLNVEHNETVLNEGYPLHVEPLDWEKCETEAERSPHLKPHSFDTILGTDVVFTPTLVEPLWKTLKLMSHSKTKIYLCLQERCAASHKLLVEKAPAYQFRMEDVTSQIDSIPACRWGKALECRLFHITVVQ